MIAQKWIRNYGWIVVLLFSILHGAQLYIREKQGIHYTGFLKAALGGHFIDPKTNQSLGEVNFEQNRYFLRSFQAEVITMGYAEFDDSSLLRRRTFDMRPVLGSPGVFKIDLFVENEAVAQAKLEKLTAKMNVVYGKRPLVLGDENHLTNVLKHFSIPLALTTVRFDLMNQFVVPERSELLFAILDAVFVAVFLSALLFVVNRLVRHR